MTSAVLTLARYVPVVAVPRTFNRQFSGSGWTRPAYRPQRSFQQPPPPVEEPDLHASMAEMRLRQPRLALALALALALRPGPAPALALALVLALALSLGPALAVAVALARTRQRIAGADPSSDGEGRGDNQRTLDAEGRGDNQRIAGRCAQTMVRGRGWGRVGVS